MLTLLQRRLSKLLEVASAFERTQKSPSLARFALIMHELDNPSWAGLTFFKSTTVLTLRSRNYVLVARSILMCKGPDTIIQKRKNTPFRLKIMWDPHASCMESGRPAPHAKLLWAAGILESPHSFSVLEASRSSVSFRKEIPECSSFGILSHQP